MNKKTASITENVLGQIKNGKVKMKPSIYFSLISFGVLLASLMSGIIMTYSSSVMFFWLRIVSSGNAAYGAKRNLVETLADFPWWTILVLIAVVVLLVYIVRNFGTAYRHKIANILVIILLISLIAGFMMSLFGVGDLSHNNFGGNRGFRQNNSIIYK